MKLSSGGLGGGYINFYLTQDKGFYAQEGLDVEIVSLQPNLNIPALTSGQVDYSTTGVSGIYAAAIKGLPVVTLMVVNGKPTWYLISGANTASVKDLKGKPIGVTEVGANSYHAVRAGLKENGLDPDKDVSWVPVGRNDRFAALKSGAIAATFVSVPDQAVAQKEYGFKVLIDLSEILDFPLAGISVSEKKMKESPEQAKRMIRGTLKGLAYVKNNAQESIEYFKSTLKLSDDIAKVLYTDVTRTYAFDGIFTDKALRAVFDLGLATGEIPAELQGKNPPQRGFDMTLLKEVLKDFKP